MLRGWIGMGLGLSTLATLATLAFAACGGRTVGDDPAPTPTWPRDARPGWVQCGARACDVGSGNQCFVCAKGEAPQCMTLDLPTPCQAPVRFWCDGAEDCKGGKSCVEACEGPDACSLPGRICR